MITLAPITPQNVLMFKAVRLRALQDTPSAFGATYAKESQLTDADWIERATRWNGDRSVLFLAMDGEIACGMAGSLLDPDDASRAHLISMWTAPTHRRHGVGRRLVNEVVTWARLRGARSLLLMVTSSNEGAIRFYEQLGFTHGTNRTLSQRSGADRIRDVPADLSLTFFRSTFWRLSAQIPICACY